MSDQAAALAHVRRLLHHVQDQVVGLQNQLIGAQQQLKLAVELRDQLQVLQMSLLGDHPPMLAGVETKMAKPLAGRQKDHIQDMIAEALSTRLPADSKEDGSSSLLRTPAARIADFAGAPGQPMASSSSSAAGSGGVTDEDLLAIALIRSAVDDAIDDPLPGCSDGRRDDEDDDDDDDLSSLRFVDTECIEWTSHQRASRLLPTPPSTVMDEEDWDDLDDGWLPTDGDTLHTGADEAVRERRVGQTRSPLVLPVLTSPEAWHLPGRDALKGSSASSSTPDVRPSFCQLLRYKPLDLPSRSGAS